MSIDRKTSVFQVRVEPHVLEAFRLVAEESGYTVSAAVRNFMLNRIRIYQEEKSESVKLPQVVKDDKLKAYEAKRELRRNSRVKKA